MITTPKKAFGAYNVFIIETVLVTPLRWQQDVSTLGPQMCRVLDKLPPLYVQKKHSLCSKVRDADAQKHQAGQEVCREQVDFY